MEFLNLHAILNEPIEFINQFERYYGVFRPDIDDKIIELFLKEFMVIINSKENFNKLNLHKFSFFVSKLPKKFQCILFHELSALKYKNSEVKQHETV